MLQAFKSITSVMRAICPNYGRNIRHNYANLLANMMPAFGSDTVYLYVCIDTFSVITDYMVATYMHDNTMGSHLYALHRDVDGYVICDID